MGSHISTNFRVKFLPGETYRAIQRNMYIYIYITITSKPTCFPDRGPLLLPVCSWRIVRFASSSEKEDFDRLVARLPFIAEWDNVRYYDTCRFFFCNARFGKESKFASFLRSCEKNRNYPRMPLRQTTRKMWLSRCGFVKSDLDVNQGWLLKFPDK